MPPKALPSAAESAPNQWERVACAPAPSPQRRRRPTRSPPQPPPAEVATAALPPPASGITAAKSAGPAEQRSAVPPSPAAPESPEAAPHKPPPDAVRPVPASQTAAAKASQVKPAVRCCHPRSRPQRHASQPAEAGRPGTAPPTARIPRKSRPAAETAAASTPRSASRAHPSRQQPRAHSGSRSSGQDKGRGMNSPSSQHHAPWLNTTKNHQRCHQPPLARKHRDCLARHGDETRSPDITPSVRTRSLVPAGCLGVERSGAHLRLFSIVHA